MTPICQHDFPLSLTQWYLLINIIPRKLLFISLLIHHKEISFFRITQFNTTLNVIIIEPFRIVFLWNFFREFFTFYDIHAQTHSFPADFHDSLIRKFAFLFCRNDHIGNLVFEPNILITPLHTYISGQAHLLSGFLLAQRNDHFIVLLCNVFYRISEIFQNQANNLNLNDQIHFAKFFAGIIIFATVCMNKTHIFFFRLFFNVRILHRNFLRRLCHMLFRAVVDLTFDIWKYTQTDLIA